MIWVSTRKTGPDADALAAIIAGFDRLLHEILASVKMPLDELSAAHFVAINIPPVALKGFERDLLHLIVKIRAIGPHVAIIVQPSLRRHTQQASRVHRWNKMDVRPLQLIQTCSCKLGNQCQGCHFPLLCGTTFLNAAELEPCPRVPTPGAQSLTLQRSLTGALPALSVLLLSGDYLSGSGYYHTRASTSRPPSWDDSFGTGPQRTPDSHTHCSPQCAVPTKTTPETTTTTTAAVPTTQRRRKGTDGTSEKLAEK